MARLTKRIKEQIVDNAVAKAGRREAENELRRRTAELAEAVRVKGWGGAEVLAELEQKVEQVNTLVRELPDECGVDEQHLGHGRSGVKAAFGGLQHDLEYGRECNGGLTYKDTPAGRVMLPAGHELSKEFSAIEAEHLRLRELLEEVETRTAAALNQFTTVAKLLEAWPEAAELLPPEEQPASTALVVRTDELNKLIGLNDGN